MSLDGEDLQDLIGLVRNGNITADSILLASVALASVHASDFVFG